MPLINSVGIIKPMSNKAKKKNKYTEAREKVQPFLDWAKENTRHLKGITSNDLLRLYKEHLEENKQQHLSPEP